MYFGKLEKFDVMQLKSTIKQTHTQEPIVTDEPQLAEAKPA